jgi:polyphenol oxidase
VFYRDARHVYRASELDQLSWLIHGFGTRSSDIPGWFENLATVKQIHSATCVAAEGRFGVLDQADALLEDRPGSVIAIKTADCIPILLVDERHRAVAAVHAGWRGTVAHIAGAAIQGMRARFGTEPTDMHAAIGPGIGECCYEVGPEVAGHFRPGEKAAKSHISLSEANRSQLLKAGVTPERIYTSNLCTMCLADQFHSFRRDAERAGRQYSFAGVRALE